MGTSRRNAQGYSVREAAKLCGLPGSTLRYYESIGLMRPVRRDASSKHRRYTAADIDYAVAVACLNATGLSIEDMRTYLGNRGGGVHSAAEQIGLLERHQRHLAEEALNLELRRRYISLKVAYWRAVQDGDAARAEEIGELPVRSVRS